ncbi:hypothetical protein IAR55_003197 [Kwoniella newhampshirensis]|uniref:Arrestin-like N-terminal domain-containing protein n=1 Tax=Kwoniella newhampshirensis TaxID=1651941 RepID=A0AAW0YYE7_9TREE
MSDEKELPPQYSMHELHTTKHGVTLRVPARSYQPGDNIPIIVSGSSSAFASWSGDATCVLEGASSAALMGKSRYQAGQIANAGLGGGGAMAITSREEHVFASTSTTLELSQIKEKAENGEMLLQASLNIPIERTCGCDGPRTKGIMPTVPTMDEMRADHSSVKWKMTVEIKRKGLIKRDIKLSLEIPVMLPPVALPDTGLSNSASSVTTFDAVTPPILTAHLTLLPPKPSKPLSIPFRIRVSTSPPPCMVSADDLFPKGKMRVVFYLSQQTWTMGIAQSRFGDAGGFNWAGVRTRAVTPVVCGGGGGKDLELEGEYDLHAEERSADGCGLSIHWLSHASVQWDHLPGLLVVSIPVNLPPAVAQR